MSYKNQQPAVSKPLIIALAVVAVIGIIYFVTTMGGGGGPEGKEAGGQDVPQSVKDMGPAKPQPGEPQPGMIGGEGR
ncbi:MAG: hypothetical protein ABIV13_03365 [Fimbriimonadales bacterium]